MQQPDEAAPAAESGVRTLRVGDFMTRELVTLKETDDLALAEQMLRLGAIRHLPVVRDGKLVGLVTQRDLLRASATRPARTTAASEIMVREPVTVSPTTSLVRAARVMLERKYGCLPVCGDDGALLGIITEADFVRFAADMVQDLDLVAEAVQGSTRA
ncbi:CBS domain-containing protein [Anaeromyxobacter diazotrophicus]|uniref:Membrane protein n=1 Tax=Anaeromyxobacter diazotrophicus TaxID=2590199 RepID=A0A7I9VRV5_9BACT|nr:CBS domain-containing protein [Anaeromyxobacter diazotrophicus]GEJ59163.1 membrane protein [Anaeromyxobacter diazotrophicus]